MELLSLATLLFFFIVNTQSNSVTEFSSLTIVGSNGTDELECLDGGTSKPCLTLGYVFTNIHHLTCDNCTVLVTYSWHEIEVDSYGYNLTYQNLTIIGINSTTIVTKDRGGLQFSGNGSMNMKGIVWYKCGSDDSCLNFNSLYTLEIENCMFINSTGIFLGDIVYVLIDNCAFHNNTLAAVLLETVQNSSLNIFNSVFQKNQDMLIFVLGIPKDVNLCNCSFEDNSILDESLVVVATLSNVEANITQCNFTNNSAAVIIYISDNSEDFTDFSTFVINDNNFLLNFVPDTAITSADNENALLVLEATKSVINIFSNNFISNRGVLMNLFTENNKGITCSLKNLHFFNNTANQTLVSITSLDISLISTNFTGNLKSLFNSVETSVISVTNSSIEIENCAFKKNKNTPLSLKAAKAWFIGENMFNGNFGLKGGAISADQNSLITVFQYGTITFRSNLAYYGGAIYIGQNTSVCVLHSNWEEPGAYIFLDNKAITEGSSIYSSTQWCDCFQNLNISFDETIPIISSPSVIQPTLNQSLKLFPGQLIVLEDWIVTDCAGNRSSCTADVILSCSICDPTDQDSIRLQLIGLPTVFLFNGTIETGLKITATLEQTIESYYVQLYFQCRNIPLTQSPLQPVISVEITKCPLGLLFNPSTQVCVCENHNSKFLCSSQLGLACIEKGYWYGPVTSNINDSNNNDTKNYIQKCPYCTRHICPSNISTSSSEFVLLSQTLDDQCEDGRGGILCMKCTDDNTFTFGAVQCITNEHCESWHPYLLLTLSILFPFITGVFLLLVIQIKTITGSGYLYGPLFFLAVLSQLPLSDFTILNKITSIFVALILLRFDIFGYIPWCFFSSINHLSATSMEFIGPTVVGIVVIGAVYSAKCCPRIFLTLQKSPVQVICLLIIVSVWSLASTSMKIIIPIQFNDVRVALNPDLQYLHEVHIPLWIISVTVLLVLVVFALLLVVSPFINLHRIKPFLDEFQSCYQDKYRWYAGIYVCSWMILLIAITLSDYILLLSIVVIIATAQYLVQPYRTKWLNIVDTLLLTDLTFLTGLLLVQNKEYAINFGVEKKALVYFLVLIPLSYIGIGVVSIILIRVGKYNILKRLFDLCCRHDEQQIIQQVNAGALQGDQNAIQQELLFSVGEREPLIRIIQNDQ